MEISRSWRRICLKIIQTCKLLTWATTTLTTLNQQSLIISTFCHHSIWRRISALMKAPRIALQPFISSVKLRNIAARNCLFKELFEKFQKKVWFLKNFKFLWNFDFFFNFETFLKFWNFFEVLKVSWNFQDFLLILNFYEILNLF